MGLGFNGWISRLGTKIAAWSLLLSTVVGLAATWYQAHLGAEEAMAAAKRDLAELAVNVELAGAKAMWELDQRALQNLLNGLVRDKFVARAVITEPTGEIFAAARSIQTEPDRQNSPLMYLLPSSDSKVLETKPLLYNNGTETVEVGTLVLTGDLDSIFAAAVDRAATVARTSAAISISIVLSLMIIVLLIVTLPLRTISEYLHSIRIDSIRHVPPIMPAVLGRKDEIGTVANSIDVLLHRILRSKQDLEASEERYRGLLEGSLQGVAVVQGNDILYSNQTAAEIFGYKTAEDFIASADIRKTFPDRTGLITIDSLRGSEVVDLGEEKRLRVDGSEILVHARLRRIRWKDTWAVQSTIVDVTDRAKAEQELRRLATRDTLTGLTNRTMFRETIFNILKMRPGFKLAVLLINVNRFKAINDLYGHPVGDSALRQMADRLSDIALHNGLVARLESDKFAILIDRPTDTSDIIDLARKIHGSFDSPFVLDNGETVRLTVSLGASVWPTDCDDADELIRTAEIAMFAGKTELNRDVKLFDSSLDKAVHHALTLEKELHNALNKNEFYLAYQPKFDLATGLLTGCEALIRWRRIDGTEVPPATFIPIAEETGVIIALGRHVMDMAASQAAAWKRKYGVGIPIAVNVSAVQFTNADVLEEYRSCITNHHLPPELLHIEVTESATMQSLDKILPVLQALKHMGTSIAIDDFGTGYSSLSYLKKMPVTHLKLDRSFVTDLPDSDSRTIAKAIVTLGHALNLKVIAEGVETEEQAQLLRDYGYDEFQGYLMSHPIAAEEFEDIFLAEAKLEIGNG